MTKDGEAANGAEGPPRPYIVAVRYPHHRSVHRVYADNYWNAFGQVRDHLEEWGTDPATVELESARLEPEGRTRRAWAWWRARHGTSAWLYLNLFAAAAGLVLLWLYGSGAYDWFIGSRFGVVAWIVGLPLAAYWTAKWARDDKTAFVWAAFAVAVLLFVGRTAILDADEFKHHNCWQIREFADVTIWECTPEGGSPAQWNGWDQITETRSSRICDQIDTSSSGGTIWRCEQDEF